MTSITVEYVSGKRLERQWYVRMATRSRITKRSNLKIGKSWDIGDLELRIIKEAGEWLGDTVHDE
jgi:hypothetical protein